MRRAVLAVATAPLLAGPAVLAFFDGGYFDGPRQLAGAAAWALVVVVALAAERPLPRSAAGRVAVAGLAALTAWTGLSMLWAPLRGSAADDFQRALLYLPAFVAAFALLRDPARRRWVEPVLAAGVLAVGLYALSERVLPDLVELEASPRAGGRLNQPLGYWNAMGALAALGLVLSARLAGDLARPRTMRAAAAAAAVPLAAATYLSFSRGALAALAVGALTLLALAPSWPQGRAVALAGVGAILAAFASEAAGEGLDLLAAFGLLAAAAAWVQWRVADAEAAGRLRVARLVLDRRAAMAAAALALLAVAVVVVVAGSDPGPRPREGAADASRLRSFETNRYEYWGAALDAFARNPVAGVGAGGFSVEWLAQRDIPETVRDAHSLYVETLAELGLVGAVLLALFLGGVAIAAARGVRAGREAAGLAAGLVVWAAHAGVDWDWELPALTGVAIVIAGALVAGADDL